MVEFDEFFKEEEFICFCGCGLGLKDHDRLLIMEAKSNNIK